ncbi:hypothetical protein F5Y18DRAFT_423437 [Xylariaceae sp. FL1019]|nr:hypothetical protein F5Y18DRAFT_423437 [Xylariaceae sp. FL1019]
MVALLKVTCASLFDEHIDPYIKSQYPRDMNKITHHLFDYVRRLETGVAEQRGMLSTTSTEDVEWINTCHKLLNEVARVHTVHWDRVSFLGWTNGHDPSKTYYQFLGHAIENSLVSYTLKQLDVYPEWVQVTSSRPLLDYALHPKASIKSNVESKDEVEEFKEPDAYVVEALLVRGADPNANFSVEDDRQTPWHHFLDTVGNAELLGHRPRKLFSTFQMLISHSANCYHTPFFIKIIRT